MIKFYLRLGQTLAREGEIQVAADQVRAARAVAPNLAAQLIVGGGIADQAWTQAERARVTPRPEHAQAASTEPH